jgi:hypothetical protein
MDCRDVDFSPTKSEERIDKALHVIPRALLMRLIAFVLHLLGAERNAVAALAGMPPESVKTVVRLVLRIPNFYARRKDLVCNASRALSVGLAVPSPTDSTVTKQPRRNKLNKSRVRAYDLA